MNYKQVEDRLHDFENWMMDLPMLLAIPIMAVTAVVMIIVTAALLFILGWIGWLLWQFFVSWL